MIVLEKDAGTIKPIVASTEEFWAPSKAGAPPSLFARGLCSRPSSVVSLTERASRKSDVGVGSDPISNDLRF